MLKQADFQEILLVEDDEIARTIHTYFLRKLGFSIDWVSTGYDAIEYTKNKDYSALILDIGLPGLNGEKVLSIIRKREKETKKYLPVIIVTAHSDPKTLSQLKTQQKADDGFIKPVRFSDFKQSLQRLYYKKKVKKIVW